MKLFQKAVALIALLAVMVLSGCAGTIVVPSPDLPEFSTLLSKIYEKEKKSLDDKRPFPPQPAMPLKTKTELAAKESPSQIPVTIGDLAYYDMAKAVKARKGVYNFTRDFPRMNNPSDQTVKTAFLFLKMLHKQLQDEGFKVVDGDCESCLRLDVDFASAIMNSDGPGLVTVIYARVRVSYRGQEVLKARDDRIASMTQINDPSKYTMYMLTSLAAVGAIDELKQAWQAAIQGQKISMAQ